MAESMKVKSYYKNCSSTLKWAYGLACGAIWGHLEHTWIERFIAVKNSPSATNAVVFADRKTHLQRGKLLCKQTPDLELLSPPDCSRHQLQIICFRKESTLFLKTLPQCQQSS